MLENTWREIEYRLDIWRATKGEHIEVVKHSVKLVLQIITLFDLDFHIPQAVLFIYFFLFENYRPRKHRQ
jgi:hypothetical protein